MLRTHCLARSAGDTFVSRVPAVYKLFIATVSRKFIVIKEKVVPYFESFRNVDFIGARHAVRTSRTSDFCAAVVCFTYLADQSVLFGSHTIYVTTVKYFDIFIALLH